MGLRVARQNHSGVTLAFLDDPTNRLHRLLPMPNDPSFSLLNKVNLYGDTIIEREAIDNLRDELGRIIATIDAQVDRAFMGEIDSLAASCEVGERLVFIGD